MPLAGAFAESVSPVGTSPKAKTKANVELGAALAPPGVQGQRPCSCAAAQRPMRLSRILRIRETAAQEAREQITLYDYLQRSCLSVLLSILLFIVFCVDSSFSTLRKKQRGPEGAADLACGHLPPLDSPRRSHLDFNVSCLRYYRLAGAGRNSMSLPRLGAASRDSATQPRPEQQGPL